MKKIKRKSIYSEHLTALKEILVAGATAGYVLGGYWLVWFFITR